MGEINRTYIDVPNTGTSSSPFQTVVQAERALKEAKDRERRQRKASKQAAKAATQKLADKKAGLQALREIAADIRKYSADARVIAAQALADRT